MTTTATAPKRAPKKKAPLDHLNTWVGRQIKALNESDMDAATKAQLVAFFTGAQSAFSRIDRVIDPESPPGPNEIGGQLIAEGRRCLRVNDLLSGGPDGSAGAGKGAAADVGL